MMDSPSQAMATGLSNWPGPSPWEPQVSTYSKGGGGACAATAVCAGREQAATNIAPISVETRCETRAGKMPALRSVRRRNGANTSVLQPSLRLTQTFAALRQVRGCGALLFASGDRRVLLLDRSSGESE